MPSKISESRCHECGALWAAIDGDPAFIKNDPTEVDKAREAFYEAARKRGDTWLTLRTIGRGDRAAYEAALSTYDADVARCDEAHAALLAAEHRAADLAKGIT